MVIAMFELLLRNWKAVRDRFAVTLRHACEGGCTPMDGELGMKFLGAELE